MLASCETNLKMRKEFAWEGVNDICLDIGVAGRIKEGL